MTHRNFTDDYGIRWEAWVVNLPPSPGDAPQPARTAFQSESERCHVDHAVDLEALTDAELRALLDQASASRTRRPEG